MDLTYEQYLALLHTLPIENPTQEDLLKFCIYADSSLILAKLLNKYFGLYDTSIALPPLQADDAHFSLRLHNGDDTTKPPTTPVLQLSASSKTEPGPWEAYFIKEAIAYARLNWPNKLHDISSWQSWGEFKIVGQVVTNIYWVLIQGAFEIENNLVDQFMLSQRLDTALVLPTLDEIESKEYFLAQTQWDIYGKSSFSGKYFCGFCGFELHRDQCEVCNSIYSIYHGGIRSDSHYIALPLKIFQLLKEHNLEPKLYNRAKAKEKSLWRRNPFYNVFYWPD